VLFVCENNQFATEVPFQYAAGNPDVASRAAGYGIAGVQLDGNDVSAIANAAGEAVARARSGGGPTLLECKTYRTRPHAEGMGDYSYRTREDVAAWRGCVHVVSLSLRSAGETFTLRAVRPILRSKARRRHTCFHVVARLAGSSWQPLQHASPSRA